MKSKLWLLNARDWFKGLILFVIVATMTFAIGALQTGVAIDKALLILIGRNALIAFLSYLIKNLITNSRDQVLSKEPASIPPVNEIK